MTTPKTYKGVLREFNTHSQAVREYFEHLPRLINGFNFDVAIAYAHSQVELGHNMLLYCGLLKLHRADRTVAGRVVEATHLTRAGFKGFFKNIFDMPIPEGTATLLENAEDVRDKIIHGKAVSEARKRQALVGVLKYAHAMNVFVTRSAGFAPFGQDLRGFKGAGQAIDKATTRWLMKGMGFAC